MKKLLLLLLSASALSLSALLGTPAQEPKKPPTVKDVMEDPVKKWAKGYKLPPPEVRAKMHAEAAKRHGHRVAALANAATPPAEFDCKDMGWCGETGDQGACGSCYLYSTVKTVNSSAVKVGIGKVDQFVLSFQFGMDCHDFGGCNGGWGAEVIDWMVKNGWPAEKYADASGKQASDYPPYEARARQCRLPANAKKWLPKDWLFISSDQSDRPATVEEMKAAILAYGRVNVALDAGGQFSNYTGGVITTLGNSIDHEINVRGWSDAKKAFLLENQWEGWGGAKTPGDNCAWLAYAAVGRLQDPFCVMWQAPTPPVPPVPPMPPDPLPGNLVLPATFTLFADGTWTLGKAVNGQMTLDELIEMVRRNDLKMKPMK